MNKKSLFVLCLCLCVLFVSAFVLVGCGEQELTSPRDLNIVDGKFVWSEVNGADGYMVYFNDDDGARFFTWYNEMSVNDENIKNYLKSGKTNMLWVRAVKLDKYGIPDVQSDRSRLDFAYIRQLDTPQRLSANNETSTLTWRNIDGAEEYYALVDGKEYKINHKTTDMGTNGTINSLPNGEYEVCIVAKGTGYNDSDQSAKIKFVQTLYQGGGNDTPDGETWTVIFDLNYEGSTPIKASAEDTKPVNKPKDPTRAGYTFEGWYVDSYCLIEAGFTSSRSKFNITANTTLYAKWAIERITTTPVYFYTTDWAVAYAKIYNDNTALNGGEGVLLNPVDGKKGWFKANIDDRTTSIEFTNGDDQTLESTNFDKATPYYKDGEWSDEMPEDVVVNPDIGQYISVNGVKYNLAENLSTDTTDGRTNEYWITVKLNKGDVIVLSNSDAHEYINYEKKDDGTYCFTGTAKADGDHTFYVKIYPTGDAVWVVTPTGGGDDPIIGGDDIGQYIFVNGSKYNLVENIDTDKTDGRLHEYMITIELEIGDVVELKAKDGYQYIYYEPECNFGGIANVDGSYEFYLKIYPDGHSIWVEVPKNDKPVEGGITFYYKNINHWTTVYAYAWNDGGNNGAWPGTKMTEVEGQDGWYSITVPETMTKIIFNGGNGKPQTADLTIDKDNTYYNGYTWKNDFIAHTGATTRTVYFFNDQGWAGVRAYAWTGGSEMSWPGLTMKAVSGHAGWYSIEISFDLANILFNSIADSKTKTVDIVIPDGTDDVYYKGGWVDSMD